MIEDEKGLIAWFTKNPVAANLLMALLVIAGLLTAMEIRKESFPDLARAPGTGETPQPAVWAGPVMTAPLLSYGPGAINRVCKETEEIKRSPLFNG